MGVIRIMNVISIPLWYDKNYELAKARNLTLTFQFHFGTIKTNEPPPDCRKGPYFNSTLVR